MTVAEWNELPPWVKMALAERGQVDLDAIDAITFEMGTPPWRIDVQMKPVVERVEVTVTAVEGG